MKFEHYQFLKEQALAACAQDGRPYPDPAGINPISLALIGDGVFSLYVRLRLLTVSGQVRIVHTIAARMVSAVMQAKAMEELAGVFTAEEEMVIRRGRNAKSMTPKSASVAEYHLATAMEALLGWLLLTDQAARLEEIMEKSFKIIAAQMQDGRLEAKEGKGEV